MIDKTRETRLRRAAQRQGLRLERSRRRDERALDYGRYWLINERPEPHYVFGGEYGATIDEIEQELTK